MKGKIIYTENDSGLAVMSGYGIDGTGRLVEIAPDAQIEGASVTSIETAQAQGLFMNSQELAKKIITQKTTATTMHDNNAFLTAEAQGGGLRTTRVEIPGFGPFLASYSLVLANASANIVTVAITGSDVLMLNANLPALPSAPEFVINGTNGANSLAILLALLKRNNLNLHRMQITGSVTASGAAAPDVFDSSNLLQSAESDLNGNLQRFQQNFQITQDGSQFNQNQRLIPNFRATLGPLNGLEIRVPAGRKLSLNFDIYSIGGAEAMVLYGK